MWAIGIVVVLLVLWGALHILISPINPEQAAPEGHIDSTCWACHMVLPSADLR